MTDTEQLDWLETQLRGRLIDGTDIVLRGVRSSPAHESMAFEVVSVHGSWKPGTGMTLRAAVNAARGEPTTSSNTGQPR